MKHFRYDKPNKKEIPTTWLVISALSLAIIAFMIALTNYWVTLG